MRKKTLYSVIGAFTLVGTSFIACHQEALRERVSSLKSCDEDECRQIEDRLTMLESQAEEKKAVLAGAEMNGIEKADVAKVDEEGTDTEFALSGQVTMPLEEYNALIAQIQQLRQELKDCESRHSSSSSRNSYWPPASSSSSSSNSYSR